jgi:hypothetical protein
VSAREDFLLSVFKSFRSLATPPHVLLTVFKHNLRVTGHVSIENELACVLNSNSREGGVSQQKLM